MTALKMTVSRMESGKSFMVGASTMVVFVEGTSEGFTIRSAGTNRKYQFTELPIGLGAALMDMSLDSNEPVNLVVKGAYVIARTKDEGYINKVKDWWNEAESRGVKQVREVFPFISDTYDELEKDLPKDTVADQTS
jgi:hypothetical protein